MINYQSAGQDMTLKYKWTDEELENIINALSNVLSFFESRGDAGFIASKLRVELINFQNMKVIRERA